MIKHNCKQAKLKIQIYFILAFVFTVLIGCINQSAQIIIPKQPEIQPTVTTKSRAAPVAELKKLPDYSLEEKTSNAIEEQVGTKPDQMAVIALNITGTHSESLESIRDAFRDEILKSAPERFKIVDSAEINPELQLSAKVSQVTSYNSERNEYDVRITIRNIKLTDLYSSPSIRAAFISAPSINTYQSESSKEGAIDSATRQAMRMLETRGFFKRIRRHKIVKSYMKKSTTFDFKDENELEKILEKILPRILESSISDIKRTHAISQTISNMKIKVAKEELLKKIRTKKIEIKTNNHSPQKEIKAQKISRTQLEHEEFQKAMVDRRYTSVIIKIKPENFTYNLTTCLIIEGNKVLPTKHFGEITYSPEASLSKGVKNSWGNNPLELNGFGRKNNVFLKQKDFKKLNNVRIANKAILDYPGIFVIW